MINFELHGLMDCAVDMAVTFRSVLSSRLDVDRAVDLLLMPPPNPRNTADVMVWLQAEQASICNRLREFVYRVPPLRVLNRAAQKLLRKRAASY
jgi:hypothetical protein